MRNWLVINRTSGGRNRKPPDQKAGARRLKTDVGGRSTTAGMDASCWLDTTIADGAAASS